MNNIQQSTCLAFACQLVSENSGVFSAYPIRIREAIYERIVPIETELLQLETEYFSIPLAVKLERVEKIISKVDSVDTYLRLNADVKSSIGAIERSHTSYQSIIIYLLRQKEYSPHCIEKALTKLKTEAGSPSEYYLFRFRCARGLLSALRGYISTRLTKITKKFDIEPEVRSPIASLLLHFDEIIKVKHPEIETTTTLIQNNEKTIFSIEAEILNLDVLENELQQYGLVLTNDITAREYLGDGIAALRLENKLELARIDLKQTQELLNLERRYSSDRIIFLEDQLRYVQKMIAKKDKGISNLSNTILKLAKNQKSIVQKSLSTLNTLIEKGITEADEGIVINELQTIKDENPSIFDKINELLIKGSVQGTAGNYLYSWLQAVSRLA